MLELLVFDSVLVLLLMELAEPDLMFLDYSFLFSLCRAYVILKPDFSFPITYYLIPFTGVVGLIIVVMVIILVSGLALHLHEC